MTYEMDIAGLKRDLPLCKVSDDLYIGAFVMFGEVGLTGEIRRVAAAERRITDAAKLGFTRFVVPAGKLRLPAGFTGEVCQVKTVEEALNAIFTA